MTRWYASKAAARQGAPSVLFPGRVLIGYRVGLPDGQRGNVSPAWAVRVDGRNAAHIDRLARDWIGHGVAPTKDGGRGVAHTHRGKPCDCDLLVRLRHVVRRRQGARRGLLTQAEAGDVSIPRHRPECVSFRFAVAEARARRVVRVEGT